MQHDQYDVIERFIADLDQFTGNKALEEVSAEFRFATFYDAEICEGWRIMVIQDLSELMYGTRDATSLRQLLQRYNADPFTFRGRMYHTLSLLKGHFAIPKTVNSISVCSWKHFLIAGMKGETPLALKIGAYLLAREQEGRIAEVLPQPRRSTHELLQMAIEEEKIERQTEIVHVRGELTLIKGGLAEVKQSVFQVGTTAADAKNLAIENKRDFIAYTERQLKRAQSYLPGEITSQIRGLLFEWAAFKCLRCDKVMTLTEGLHNSCEIDEVRPRRRGGRRTWNNIQALCRQCNQLRALADQRGEKVEWTWDFRAKRAGFWAKCSEAHEDYERRRSQGKKKFPLFPDYPDSNEAE